MKKKRDLAIEIRKRIGVDPSDCRNIMIFTDSLCQTFPAIEILERALDLYIQTPEARIERLTTTTVEVNDTWASNLI